MDPATHLVATIQEVALSGLETAPGATTGRRIGTRAPDLPDSFIEPASLTRLCESWVRETRTPSLSGGRRPALRCASSDPTVRVRESRTHGEGGQVDQEVGSKARPG